MLGKSIPAILIDYLYFFVKKFPGKFNFQLNQLLSALIEINTQQLFWIMT